MSFKENMQKKSRTVKKKAVWDLPVDYTSLSQYQRREVREQYRKEQKGKCMFCGESLDDPPAYAINRMTVNQFLFPPNFFKSPVHLQHCRVTGMTEGAVHAKCNAVLWQYHGR